MQARATVRVLTVLTALQAMGYGVMFTMLDDYRDEYHVSPTALGGVVAIGFFTAFAAQIALAPLADRGHARRLLTFGIVFDLLGLAVMAFGRAAPVLLAGRAVMGVGIGMCYPAIRRIVVLASSGDVGGTLGGMLSADVAGFAAGPAVAAVLTEPVGIPAPYLAVIVGTLATVPVLARCSISEQAPVTTDGPTERMAWSLLRLAPFRAAVVLGCATFLMIGVFDALWALVLDDLDAPDWVANLGIVLFALPLVVFGRTGGRLAERFGPFRLGWFGALVGAACMASYGLLPTAGGLFVAAMVHSINDGFTVTSASVAIGLTVPAERQASAHGLFGGVQVLVGGMTALAAGVLYEHSTRAVAYGACAVAMGVCVLLSRLFLGPRTRRM